MAGPLVPQQNVPSAFPQQGQVDWVELSNQSVQISVAVLARLSKAGVDPFTLQVGKAVCFNIALGPPGQERISDEIFKLKKYSSYGDLIWFGFGVKQIVTDLAETEEGMTLVGLCAALTTTYDSLFTARVLRELCVLCKAPQSFTPALRQWKALVELCAGILSSSHFELVLTGFRRLISPYSRARTEPTKPTKPTELAKAIKTVGDVSKSKIVNASFTGGLDCAWLAAFSEWVLCLDVGIFTSAGLAVYRSQSRETGLPQISVVASASPTSRENGSFLVSKASLIPSGISLLQGELESSSVNYMNWRCDWTAILHEVFPGAVDALLSGQTGRHFRDYVYCVSLMESPDLRKAKRYDRNDRTRWTTLNPVDPLLWTQENCRGQRFLRFASRRLPELQDCFQAVLPETAPEKVAEIGRKAYHAIEKTCSCSRHSGIESSYPGTCLNTLAEVIVIFLWINLVTIIDDSVYPSPTGLSNLYIWQGQSKGDKEDIYMNLVPREYPVRGIDLVFHVLSGLSSRELPMHARSAPAFSSFESEWDPPRSDRLARAGAGICVYNYALENPNLSAGLISKFRCVRGYIAHSGVHFREIRNFRNPDDFPIPNCEGLPQALFEKFGHLSMDALVQETDDEGHLETAYQVHYTDKDRQKKSVWLDIGLLLQRLAYLTRTFDCQGGCPPLYALEKFPGAQYSWRTTITGDFINPPMKFDAKIVEKAQEVARALDYTSDTWILAATSTVGDSGSLLTIVVDQFFSLCLSIALFNSKQMPISLFPFTRCFTCLIERGCWCEADEKFGEEPAGNVKLVTPDRKIEKFRWDVTSPDEIKRHYESYRHT